MTYWTLDSQIQDQNLCLPRIIRVTNRNSNCREQQWGRSSCIICMSEIYYLISCFDCSFLSHTIELASRKVDVLLLIVRPVFGNCREHLRFIFRNTFGGQIQNNNYFNRKKWNMNQWNKYGRELWHLWDVMEYATIVFKHWPRMTVNNRGCSAHNSIILIKNQPIIMNRFSLITGGGTNRLPLLLAVQNLR